MFEGTFYTWFWNIELWNKRNHFFENHVGKQMIIARNEDTTALGRTLPWVFRSTPSGGMDWMVIMYYLNRWNPNFGQSHLLFDNTWKCLWPMAVSMCFDPGLQLPHRWFRNGTRISGEVSFSDSLYYTRRGCWYLLFSINLINLRWGMGSWVRRLDPKMSLWCIQKIAHGISKLHFHNWNPPSNPFLRELSDGFPGTTLRPHSPKANPYSGWAGTT